MAPDAPAMACDCDVFVANGGGDLALQNLTIEDAPRNGILVEVPADASGEIAIELRDVRMENNGLHGLCVDGIKLTNDRDGINVEQAGAGQGIVRLQKVLIEGNGGDPIDATGVEVIEVP